MPLNGTTRIAAAEMELKKEKGGEQENEISKIVAKGAKQPKFPLKAGASEHNHSK